ncbi:glycosyltransferase [Aneurinibacillus sp. Ricciae_BoGa-3]|uniref:glycosyltransferase n=1 Tax=Aneurinibacillus sp. Ricciae_BoGa-3 TaxID=3022697 RepID=UPI0023424AE4|nr:glycosyltransferase [Aneurinibacillus sp. Ricciae_BoGa-3]WCK56181.1 glycosyltransferase [Aneurinibacillus sp. Ricciae_BoGa-3]
MGLVENRRLAVIDTVFPWKLSGFRYWENQEIFRQRPDTLFFATNPHTDEFPTHIYNFSDFIPLALSGRVTDVYNVFLNLAVSLIGRTQLSDGTIVPGSNPLLNIWPFIQVQNIKLHTTLYPGGGLAPTTPINLLQLDKYFSSIFTNIQEIRTLYPNSIYVPGMINKDFYAYTRKQDVRPIQLVFSAHQGIRKNFPLMANAFNQLDNSFHLHIIGNWEGYLHLLTNNNYTFHGVLQPEQIMPIYQSSHVFISCSTQDHDAFDGFPTTAAADAMSTGCVLVTTNPRQDRYVLASGLDYIEINENRTLNEILQWIKNNFHQAMQIGINGSNKIRSHYDAKLVVKTKLKTMGLI